MTYDEAIRIYGRQAGHAAAGDGRRPRGVSGRALETPKLDAKLPIVAIRIPHVGDLSGTERDDIKVLFSERPGAKVFDDIKRLEKTWPDAIQRLRSDEAEADDLSCSWPGRRRKRVRSTSRVRNHGEAVRQPRLHGCGPSPGPCAEIRGQAQAVCRRPKDVEIVSFPVGDRLPDVRVGRGREALDRRTPSIYLAA